VLQYCFDAELIDPELKMTVCKLLSKPRLQVWTTVLCLSISAPANAAWLDWWKRADQRGIELLENGQVEQAGQTFSSPDWRGTAKFLSGDFAQAADEFSRSDDIEAIYNRATTLAHAGELEQSLAVFDDLLERRSTHADGIANRGWVSRELQRQQQQDSPQQNQPGDPSESEQQSGEAQQGEGDKDSGEGQQQGAGDDPEQGQATAQSAAATSQEKPQPEEQALKSALQNQRLSDEADQSRQEIQQQPATEATEHSAYDEASQAIEQQLQRIPDDPAGLLRNKLRVTHQSRYADIRQGKQPW
jgi:Ca-activated chloride channel family protein